VPTPRRILDIGITPILEIDEGGCTSQYIKGKKEHLFTFPREVMKTMTGVPIAKASE
jgi:hypothetical protein